VNADVARSYLFRAPVVKSHDERAVFVDIKHVDDVRQSAADDLGAATDKVLSIPIKRDRALKSVFVIL
jgi:hypothetical protein